MNFYRSLLLIFVLALTQGCARGKVTLPKPDAPLKDRQAAFDRYAMPPNMSLDQLHEWSKHPGAPINQQSVLPEYEVKSDVGNALSVLAGVAGLSTSFFHELAAPWVWAGLGVYQATFALPGFLEWQERQRAEYNGLLAKRLSLPENSPKILDRRFDTASDTGQAAYFLLSAYFHNVSHDGWAKYYGYDAPSGNYRRLNAEIGFGYGFASGLYVEPVFAFFLENGSANWVDGSGAVVTSQKIWQRYDLAGVHVGKSWPMRVGAWNPARVWGLGLGLGPAWIHTDFSDFAASGAKVGSRSVASQGMWARPYVRVMNILPRNRMQVEIDLGWRWLFASDFELVSGSDGFVGHPMAARDYLGRPFRPDLDALELALRIRYGKQPFVRHESSSPTPLPAASPSSTIGPPPPLTP